MVDSGLKHLLQWNCARVHLEPDQDHLNSDLHFGPEWDAQMNTSKEANAAEFNPNWLKVSHVKKQPKKKKSLNFSLTFSFSQRVLGIPEL